jgi:hypothetical protein
MAGEFRKALFTVLFGEVVAAATAIVLSPRAREVARPYLIKGIRKAMALGEEMKGMVDEAKVDADRIIRDIEADRAEATSH